MATFYMSETTVWSFVADDEQQADAVWARFQEDGVDTVEGMNVVGDVQVKLADYSTEREW